MCCLYALALNIQEMDEAAWEPLDGIRTIETLALKYGHNSAQLRLRVAFQAKYKRVASPLNWYFLHFIYLL